MLTFIGYIVYMFLFPAVTLMSSVGFISIPFLSLSDTFNLRGLKFEKGNFPCFFDLPGEKKYS